MLDEKRKPDWCIVRWHDGELMVRREYQWEAQGKWFAVNHKWAYMAKGFKSNEDALQWVSLFKE